MTTFRGIGDPSVDGIRVASQDDLNQAVAQAEQAVADAQAAASSSEASATDAQAVLDEFNTIYLGAKSSDPTLDNNNNPLITGALYYNDVELVVKVYNGTIWNSIGVLGPGTVVDENIVVFDGTTGNQIKDSGAKVTDFGDANGPGSAVDGNLAAFDGISGKLLQDAVIPSAQVVTNSGTSTAGHLAVFTDAGGKIIQDGGPVVSGGDVTGPSGSTDGNLAVFDGTTGKILKDGGTPTGDVAGPASAVDTNIATFDGATGKIIQDGGSTVAAVIAAAVAASGDVDGPGSAIDGNLAVFDGTSGTLLKDGGAPGGGGGIGDNLIINGNMNIAQRGTQFLAVSTGTYGLDRFVWNQAGSELQMDLLQANFVSLAGSDQTGWAVVSTPETTINAGDFGTLTQHIEGYNTQALQYGTSGAESVTLSFWVRAGATGTHAAAFQNAASDRSYVATYTISAADTWEFKTITIAGDTTGTWDTTNGRGLSVRWVLGAGTTYQTTAGSWQAGNFLGVSGMAAQLTGFNDFALGQVKLEIGTSATTFQELHIAEELAQCQRYYASSYNAGKFPGGIDNAGASSNRSASNGFAGWVVPFPQAMRTLPTVVSYSPVTGTSGKCHASGSDYNSAIDFHSYQSVNITNAVAAPAGQRVFCHWTADAEL